MRKPAPFFPKALLTAIAAVFLAVTSLGLSPAFGQEPNKLTIHTSLTATTAQLPLLGALKAGWPQGREVTLEYWKNLDDLRAMMLSGQGDVWVGHLEGFARAANRGAPVTLAAVTVWRKFYFVSAPLPLGPQGTLRWPDSVEELLSYASENNIELSNTPRNSPISAILEQLTTNGKPPNALSLPPQQLSLELLNGQRLFGLMPEPISTSVILKNPSLKIIGSLEEEYARRFGGPDIMPQAGVAVNTSLAEQNPPLIQNLIDLMGKSVSDLSGKPIAQAAALLPEEVHQALGEEVLLKSLEREPLIAKGASLVRQEIDNFLHLAAPELFEPGAPALPSDFIFEAK